MSRTGWTGVLSLSVVCACTAPAPDRTSADAAPVDAREPAPTELDLALAAGRAALDEAQPLAASASDPATRERTALAIDRLVAAPEVDRSLPAAALLAALGLAAHAQGDLARARAALDLAHESYARMLSADDLDLLQVRADLALVLRGLGEIVRSRELYEQALAAADRTLPDEHPVRQKLDLNLGDSRRRAGDLTGAEVLLERLVAVRERTLDPMDPDLARARGNLALVFRDRRDFARERVLEEQALAGLEHSLSADHPDLARIRVNLARTLFVLGELAAARPLCESALAAYRKSLPADHADALRASEIRVAIDLGLGRIADARVLCEEILAARERAQPVDPLALAAARNDLAAVLRAQGLLAEARTLQEQVVAAREKLLPPEHANLLMARANLASTLVALGEIERGREIEEEVLAVRQRIFPPDHPDLLMARNNLAGTLLTLGDHFAARALFEETLSVRERTRGENDVDLAFDRINLAVALKAEGDFGAARELEERALASLQVALPPDHPRLAAVRNNLAVTSKELGDFAAALVLEREALSALELTRPADDPDALSVRANYATTLFELGDAALAVAEWQQVLAARLARFPEDHPDVLTLRRNLALGFWALESDEDRERSLSELTRGLQRSLAAAASLPRREAQGHVARVANELSALLSVDSSPRPAAFELIENARAVASSGDPLRGSAGGRAGELATRARESRSAIERAIETARTSTDDVSALSLAELVRTRDACEADLLRELRANGGLAPWIDVATVARALPDESAAVCYRVYKQVRLIRSGGPRRTAETESLVAFVVTPAGALSRVELGALHAVARAITRWRDALGKPLESRGQPALSTAAVGDEVEAGREVRALVLDPVLALAPDARALSVCLDGPLFLVPLDALPGRDTERALVGDRVAIRVETSLARLIARGPRARVAAPSLVVIGGVDYDACGDTSSAPAVRALEPRSDRGAPSSASSPLPGTKVEALAVAQQFERSSGVPAVVLTGAEASKRAFLERSDRVTFLHIATHGWFARGVDARDSARGDHAAHSRMTLDETLESLVPMSLCGLALAGANCGGARGQSVDGIITAEEMAGLDLSACELAVLSACETNVGVTRAGQGIESLQAALHAAGAATAITSLWKVDDQATRELFADFYTRIWVEKESKAEALWGAKSSARARGRATRDWAAWVLTGESR